MNEMPMRPHNEDELLTLLGLMVREAGHVELRLRVVAMGLADSPHGELITAGQSVSQLLDMCKALATEVETSDRRETLAQLTRRCRSAFSRRDQYVHGAWTIDGETSEWMTIRSRRNQRVPTFAPLSAEELGELVRELNSLSGDIMTWLINAS
uniref:Uncharacterized protein n=1 Tax=Streptomyces sp. NBC_00003 TaxID=2903608 RepID=A0AAU2V0A2_9ACTN